MPDAISHYNAGVLCQQRGQLEEATTHYRRAIADRPEYARAHMNLGACLADLGRHGEAAECYLRAVECPADDASRAEILSIAGGNLSLIGRWEEAAACLDRCLELRPDHAVAHCFRSGISLLRGDLPGGFADAEWRWRQPHYPPRWFPVVEWHGEALPGQVIRLHAEQGLGDTLQFIRYAPMVRERCARLVVEFHPGLEKLLTRCPGIDDLVPGSTGDPKHASLLSLPYIFGTTLETIPAPVPYVFADPTLVDVWRDRLMSAAGNQLMIGIAWQGSPTHRLDRHRSFPLAAMEPLAKLSGVRLVSLQIGAGTEQLPKADFDVVQFDGLDQKNGIFMDTAAMMRTLDLVVTCDAAVAHLAGAMGVPVWVSLSTILDGRWMLDREDSPWYPTMRLFRQERLGEWGPVFERMAARLQGQGQRQD